MNLAERGHKRLLVLANLNIYFGLLGLGEEKLGTLLDDHSAGMQFLHSTLSKLKLVLILSGRWSPK